VQASAATRACGACWDAYAGRDAHAGSNADGHIDTGTDGHPDGDAAFNTAAIGRLDACRANAIANGDPSWSRWFGESRFQGPGCRRRRR
jgi:hypothetical protein